MTSALRLFALQILQRPATQRFLVAGPLALLASIAVLAGMPHWLPEGPGRVDNLVFPVILFPLIWALAFFYACLAADIVQAALILCLVIAAQVAIIAVSLVL